MGETQQDIDQVRRDIYQAREWAKDHFNVHQKEDHLLAPPTFDIEFPEPDKMTVWPRAYGRRLWPGFSYRLAWKGKMMVWISENPLTGQRIELVVA